MWREKSGAPRTAFAAHLYNEAFGLLGAHPRMIEPVEQIFGEKVYMHQYKINAKSAFTGDVWQWHQDYGTWKRDDGMPEPRAMNIAIFLDEVMPINGPLMLVPRSQHAGDLKASHDLQNHVLSAVDAGRGNRDRYAAICQSLGIVPIVEPEVLLDGDHSIERCFAVTEAVQRAVFQALYHHGVELEYIILKPSMVVAGKDSAVKAGSEEIAEKTLKQLRRSVPAAVPASIFYPAASRRRKPR